MVGDGDTGETQANRGEQTRAQNREGQREAAGISLGESSQAKRQAPTGK
jgi:hypothetical protein